jgi:multisubunit Na+/H+ antiporter MnhC subunit
MKYNLTNETYLPETVSNFPGATKMTYWDILLSALILNIIPLLISIAAYIPILLLTDKIFKKVSYLSLFTSGFLLSLTTPLLYYAWAEKPIGNFKLAEEISFVFIFIISITVYILLNRNKLNQQKVFRFQK